MLLLSLLLAARALAQSTYTVTILDDNPDQRTLNTHSTTATGDVFTTVTLHPDGVNEDGQTKYALHPGVSAEHTVTSEMSIPPTTMPTTTRPGTATHSLPWQQGHHMEVVTVTDADGTVHNVTRVDQQSTHVTVSASVKPDGTTVLVSSGSYPTSEDVETTVIITRIHTSTTATPTDSDVETTVVSTRIHTLPAETSAITPAVKIMQNVRRLPECVNGQVILNPIETAAWPLYDRLIAQPSQLNYSKPATCSKLPFHTYYSRYNYFPMETPSFPPRNLSNDTINWNSAHPVNPIAGHAVNDTMEFQADMDPKFEKQRKRLGDGRVVKFEKVAEKLARQKHCGVIIHNIDFGSCGGEAIRSPVHTEVFGQVPSSNFFLHYMKKLWWILPAAVMLVALPLLLCFILPCFFVRRRRQREARGKTPNGKEVVNVFEGSESSGSGSGAGSSEVVTTGTSAGGAGPVAATTGAPAEVVTTATETGKEGPGTMRRAAEEGRAGQRVRFGENPGETTTTTTANQVDGTAEVRTGSEVFDVGSMRGRKRNRGDEPL